MATMSFPLLKSHAFVMLPSEVSMVLGAHSSGFVGEVMKVGKVAGQWQMELEDRRMRRCAGSRWGAAFGEGQPVNLLPALPASIAPRKKITASGSFHVEHEARVAKPHESGWRSKHDAELISKIWGADLAFAGIMIEELFGADNLRQILSAFEPSDARRAGIMLDHLVPGSKEARIAAEISHMEERSRAGTPLC